LRGTTIAVLTTEASRYFAHVNVLEEVAPGLSANTCRANVQRLVLGE